MSIQGTVILFVGSAVMFFVAIATLFRTRRFCCEVIARRMGKLALQISGVHLVVDGHPPTDNRQVIYVSNHTSTLDLFAVIALGLPRTRYFLSGFLRKILPLGLIGYLIGVFWTVPYRFPDTRRRIFQNAERVLNRTGDSAYLTPEGSRITTGEVGHFNRGAFHLATNLKADIVPVYISTSQHREAGTDLVAEPGTVAIRFLPPISTSDWNIIDLDANRDAARDVFVRFQAEGRPEEGPAS